MREKMRLVEMKVVDHVRIAHWLKENSSSSFDQRAPAAMMVFCGAPSRIANRQLCLHSIPAIAIGKLGLVQNFKENSLRIPGGIMLRQRSPEIRQLLHNAVIFCETRFEVALRMQIDDHSQLLIQNHLHSPIQISEVVGRNFVWVDGSPSSVAGLRSAARDRIPWISSARCLPPWSSSENVPWCSRACHKLARTIRWH